MQSAEFGTSQGFMPTGWEKGEFSSDAIFIRRTDLAQVEKNIERNKPPLNERFIPLREWFLPQKATSERTKQICASQYRAIKYLFSDKDIDTGSNPLADILTLISPNLNKDSAHIRPLDFQLCIKGPPQQKGVFERLKPERKQEQYTRTRSPTGELKRYRTLARFDSWQTSLVRGLYLIARTTDENPELLRRTLQEYVRTVTGDKGDITGMGLGLLEVLYNANLLRSREFSQFSRNLRKLVLEGTGGYDGLVSDYHYRIVDDKSFWKQTDDESVVVATPLTSAAIDDRQKQLESRIKWFPSTTRWEAGVRKRQALKDRYVHLTPHQAITQALPSSEENLIDSVVTQRIAREQTKEEVGSIERQLLSHVRTDFEYFIRGIANGTPFDTQDTEFLSQASRLVANHFIDDFLISAKTKTILKGNNTYVIDPDRLKEVPLVRWLILFKKDPAITGVLKQWAKSQPDSLYLLFKSMVYDLEKRFFATGEKDFLFDPDYRQKANSQDLEHLIEEIAELTGERQADLATLFARARVEMAEAVKPLVVPQIVKERREKLARLLANRLRFMHQYRTVKPMDAAYFIGGAVAISGTLVGAGYLSLEYMKHENKWMHVDLKVDKSIPDAISREGLRLLPPRYYAQVKHLPTKYFSGGKGEDLGYFPAGYIPGEGFYLPDSSYTAGTPPTKRPNLDIEIVPSLNDMKVDYADDQLAYKIDDPTLNMYAPVGWKIVKVIQEGGMAPEIDETGISISYPIETIMDKLKEPKRVILILEKLDLVYDGTLHPRVLEYKGVSSSKYYPYISLFHEEDIKNLNPLLQNDPHLQKLQREFKEEMQTWEAENGKDLDKGSQIVKKYINLYAEYTDTYRYYALSFQVNNKAPAFATLKAIADKSQDGYFCSVASFAFRDFLGSAGVRTFNQPGIRLRNYRGQMWGHIAHMNNVVFLPNGEVLFVDMTPPTTEKTPKEDIEALETKDPSDFDLVSGELYDLGSKAGIAFGSLALLYIALPRLIGTARKDLIFLRIRESLTEKKEFNGIEDRLIGALVSKLAFMPDDENLITKTAYLFQLLQDFSVEKHGLALQWLTESPEGREALQLKDPKEAIKQLASCYYSNIGDIRDNLPASVLSKLEEVAELTRNDSPLTLTDEDLPFDYLQAYELARIILEEETQFRNRAFTFNVAVDLKYPTGLTEAVGAITHKAQLILDMLKLSYARGEIPDKSKPYLNAIYKALSGNFLESIAIPHPVSL